MNPKPIRVTSTAKSRAEAAEMMASMVGAPGAKPFRGRLLYGADAIKSLRRRLKMSMAQFAGLMGLQLSELVLWEQGRRLPGASTMALAVLADRHWKKLGKELLGAGRLVRSPDQFVSLSVKVDAALLALVKAAAKSEGLTVSEYFISAAYLRLNEHREL